MDANELIRDEYNQIQQRRQLFSGFIMDWLRVMVPVGGGLFGFFSWLGQRLAQDTSQSYFWLLPLFGWLLFAIAMITWRAVVHHIDRQIVAMYPRMLELEQRRGWFVDTIYYYNNLSRHAGRVLMGFVQLQDDQPERRNFRLYVNACRRSGQDPHDLLLRVWDQLGYRSVGSRGHAAQDWAVYIISIVALAIASILAYELGACDAALAVISAIFFIAVTEFFT